MAITQRPTYLPTYVPTQVTKLPLTAYKTTHRKPQDHGGSKWQTLPDFNIPCVYSIFLDSSATAKSEDK